MSRNKATTIVDVARAARVSKAAVSIVLNDRDGPIRISPATRAAVLDAANRLGYTPNHAARCLRRRHTGALALIVSRLLNPYFAEIATAAVLAAKGHGYEVNIVEAELTEMEVEVLAKLRDRRADGVIIARPRLTRPANEGELARRDQARHDLASRGLPMVVLLDSSPEPTVPAIRTDDEAGAYLATRHLIELGHRRIGHLNVHLVPPMDDDRTVAVDRFRGYRRALAEAGVQFEPSWLVGGNRGLSGGRELARTFLAAPGPRPTAALVANDLLAIGVLRGLFDAGVRVPDDVAIVSFDGIEAGAHSIPSLTTIEHPREVLGRLGVETMIQAIRGELPDEIERVLPTRLVVRESCGAVRTNSATALERR